MIIINNGVTNPYFNLAAEEYLLKNFTDDVFMLWQNEPCIVVGKHQNAMGEINHRFVAKNGIKVARRISGGGTVYHDFGNLNFTFIKNGKEGKLVDFKAFTQPIINVLCEFGIEAYFGGNNDIRIGNKKISGNAEHIYKNRVLHHGTLLFNSDLDKLDKAIHVRLENYTDKAVKSVRARVGNISEFLNSDITLNRFKKAIFDSIKTQQFYQFTEKDIVAVENLVQNKFVKEEWIYGYSPSYELKREAKIGDEIVTIYVKIKKAIVAAAEISASNPFYSELSKQLVTKSYVPYSIKKIVEETAQKFPISSDKIEEILFELL